MPYKVFNVPAFDETYEIVDKIGEAGGGIVYKAYHKRLQKYVVVKQIKDSIKGKVDVRGEADILKQLRHSYLPQVFDFFTVGSDYYTVIDFIEGSSFDRLLHAKQPYPQGYVVKWARQLCEALDYLHSHKILHSDIKPGNVMLSPNGDICLIDFNISLSFETSARAIGQSAGYAPPELYVRPSKPSIPGQPSTVSGSVGANYYTVVPGQIDPRSDIYSLGATLYHMVTGQRPAPANQPPIPLRERNPALSDGLVYIIEKAMQPDPKQRFQSAAEMLRALNHIVLLDRSYRKKSTRQFLTAAALSTIAAGFLVLTLFGWRQVLLEERAQYDDYIYEAYDALEQADYPRAQQLSILAQALMEREPEAYYVSAQALYRDGEHRLCAMYILEHLDMGFSLRRETKRQTVADLHYMLGNCYLELGKTEHSRYADAEEAFADALELYDENPDYYRDAAIAAVYNDRPSVGRELLQQAQQKGLAEPSILLVQGALSRAQGDYADAVIQLRNAAQRSGQAQLKLRAYFAAAEIYETDRQDLPGAVAILEEASRDSVLAGHLGLTEALGLLYSKAAVESEEDSYYRKALACYQTVADKGNATYAMLYNISVIHRAIGEFDNAKAQLLLLAEEFPGNYKTFLQLSSLAIEVQKFKAPAQRSYQEAYDYYQQAAALYPQRENRDPDYEMEQLEETIRDYQAYGLE